MIFYKIYIYPHFIDEEKHYKGFPRITTWFKQEPEEKLDLDCQTYVLETK